MLVRGFVRRRVGDVCWTDDVVQECLYYLQREYGATIEEQTVREESVHFPLPRTLRELLPA